MITKSLPFPLDDEGFFRRDCPLCMREFKVLLKPDELGQVWQVNVDDYLLVNGHKEQDDEETGVVDEPRFFCPYCGQSSARDAFWTEEQLAYIHVVVENIMAVIVNENLMRPLQSMNTGGLLRVEGREMAQREEWISQEVSDMKRFDLPCCDRSIKVDDQWSGTVRCFFCGFAHETKPSVS